jgi:hypothetical protein
LGTRYQSSDKEKYKSVFKVYFKLERYCTKENVEKKVHGTKLPRPEGNHCRRGLVWFVSERAKET